MLVKNGHPTSGAIKNLIAGLNEAAQHNPTQPLPKEGIMPRVIDKPKLLPARCTLGVPMALSCKRQKSEFIFYVKTLDGRA